MFYFEKDNPYLMILTLFNIITLIVLVFIERKNPEKVIKWMGVLLFLPFIGFVFYLFLGKGPTIGKRKKMLAKFQTDRSYRKELVKQLEILKKTRNIQNRKIADMVRYNILQNSSVVTANQDVKLYSNMREHFFDLYQDIENAKEYINLMFFIIKPDKYGKELVEILAKKQREGVEVRFIYDEIGSYKINRRFFKPLIDAGGTAVPFLPTFFFHWTNVNYRNHRKIVVIDGEIAYTGGTNISKDYVGENKRITPWRDTQIRIVGHAAHMLNLRFLEDFNFATKSNLKPNLKFNDEINDDYLMQVVSSGPDSHEVGIESAYIKAIYLAEEKIYLQTPYFILDEPFKMALESAIRSGLDVRIMIPGVPDKPFVYLSTLSYAEDLYKLGAKVYLYNGFIHSKTLLVDNDISSVGTFNIDTRSFKLHFENTVFIYENRFAKVMENTFKKDIKNSQKMNKEYFENKTIWQKFIQRIAILFSPLF